MSNVELAPAEVTCLNNSGGDGEPGQVLDSRTVPLGGPRGMNVRRTLPQRSRSLIGAWCFVDHYGPDDVSTSGGMRVAGHPHTGLQTVSWLFSGEVEHRDTVGTHAFVRPGELNLMTAGSGIAHSEYSTERTRLLHGAQLWVVLPDAVRFTDAAFEHYAPPVIEKDGVRTLVFLGSLLGQTSPVDTFTPLLGAEITAPRAQDLPLDVDPSFEHGILVDSGEVTVAGVTATAGQLIYVGPGRQRLTCTTSGPARVLVLGGEPFGERIVMWWNFIGRDHEEIVAFREQWQRERDNELPAKQFGDFPEEWEVTLPAPELPNVRLRQRG